MPHNRAKREQAVRNKYDVVCVGGEYSVLQPILFTVDAIITGGNFTYEYLKQEALQFGINVATCLANAGVNPITEPLYFDKFVFENWEEPVPGVRVPLPNKFVPYVAARKKTPPTHERDVLSLPGRFRAVNDVAPTLGYSAAFPNFHQADYGAGVVYGTILLKPGYVEWRDVPANQLGNPGGDIGSRFRAVNDWAGNNGFSFGFPNFHEANYGHGVVYGTMLLRENAAGWADIPAADLGNPGSPEERLRAVNDWASGHGFRGAFPNFHQADYGAGVVYGTILIKQEAADWRDISAVDLKAV